MGLVQGLADWAFTHPFITLALVAVWGLVAVTSDSRSLGIPNLVGKNVTTLLLVVEIAILFFAGFFAGEEIMAAVGSFEVTLPW